MEKEIFNLTDEQIKLSKSLYNGKIVKCLIAPYHSPSEVGALLINDKNVTLDSSFFLFPERELSLMDCQNFVSKIIEDDKIQEVIIITSNHYIIWDIVQPLTKVLTIDNELADYPMQTLRANIMEMQGNFFIDDDEHDNFKIPEEVESYSDKFVNEIIDAVNYHIDEEKVMSKKLFNTLQNKVKLIGDSFLKSSLEVHMEKIVVEKFA